MSSKRNTYTFVLKNVSIQKINETYGIDIPDIVNVKRSRKTEKRKTTTKLSDLDKRTTNLVTFLDETKCEHVSKISSIDFSRKYNCFWCKHSFANTPIGCPIKYFSPRAAKKYTSKTTNNVYHISENVTKHRLHNSNDDSVELSDEEYYETDGVFCSFNCCKAWIDDNKHDCKYNLSNMLLLKLYRTLVKERINLITPAPHWRLLREYGGDMSIEQFRESFNKVEHKFSGEIRNTSIFVSVGQTYEENIKF